MKANSLIPDKQQAWRHLSYIDQFQQKFTFQTFDDNSDRREPKLAKILHGTLDELFDDLVKLNRKGAGVYVTVNETDLNGRKTENIQAVRAIWQEDDGDGLALPIEPHLSIESSPNKYHHYFFTYYNNVEEFAAVQERMVKSYGSDKNAKDLSRVLRLAGFYHQKVSNKKGLNGTPHLVSITNTSDNSYLEWDELIRVFPPVKNTPKRTSNKKPSINQANNSNILGCDDMPDAETIEDLRDALMFLAETQARI